MTHDLKSGKQLNNQLQGIVKKSNSFNGVII